MDLMEGRTLNAFGVAVVGLVATAGGIVAPVLAAAAVQGGFVVAGRLGRARRRPTGTAGYANADEPSGMRPAGRSPRLGARTEQELLTRQAWWRLRC